MNLSDELIKFRDYVDTNQIPIHLQESVIKEGHAWCADWWFVEVINAILYEDYMTRPSIYLDHNSISSRYDTLRAKELKLMSMELLEKHKDFSDTILIPEVGRGLDILLASSIKKWKKILCYDSNSIEIEKVKEYFKDYPIYATTQATAFYDYKGISEPVIIFAHRVRIGPEIKEVIKANKNLLLIIDGEVL